jgi:protein MBA1
MARASMSKAMSRVNKAKNPTPPKDFQAKMLKEMRLPGVFVPLVRSEQPQDWNRWFEYQRLMWVRWGASFVARASFWTKGIEKWSDYFSLRSRVNLESSTLARTAKDLHQRMGTAVAAGDHEVLKILCTNNLYHNLSTTTLANRPADEKRQWELVGNTKARVVAHDVSPLIKRLVQQVIVAIDSTQRLTKISTKTGKPVPNGVTERAMHENLVLLRDIDPDTYQKSPWKIWGTVPGTQLDEYKATIKALEDGNREQIKSKYPDLFPAKESKD